MKQDKSTDFFEAIKLFLAVSYFLRNFVLSKNELRTSRQKREKRNAKIADLFIDMGKYTATAIFITSLIGEFGNKWMLYSISLALVTLFITIGITYLNKD